MHALTLNIKVITGQKTNETFMLKLRQKIENKHNSGFDMNQKQLDAGLIQVILDRFEHQRLPYLLSLQKSCDAHQALSSFDLDFLKSAIDDTRKNMPIAERNKEYFPLVAKLISLYLDITTKALQLEQQSKK